MQRYHAFTIVLVLATSACLHQENSSSALLGDWQTPGCEKAATQWIRGIYRFEADGDILYSQHRFSDADCITPVSTPPLAVIGHFHDLGAASLTSGLDGYKVSMELNDTAFGATGFYTRDGSRLCFSYAISLTAAAQTFFFGDDIDFLNCLQTYP